jgi:hypothetical protein
MKDINLIPKSYFNEKKKKKKKIYIINIVVISILLVSLAFVIPLSRYFKYKNELKVATKKAEETSGYVDKTKILDEFHSIYDKRKDIAASILNIDNMEIDLFEEIEKTRPENIFVMNYKMTGESKNNRTLVITCISNSEDEVIVFLNNLRKEVIFKDVLLTSINLMTSESQKSTDVEETNGLNDKYTSTIELYY